MPGFVLKNSTSDTWMSVHLFKQWEVESYLRFLNNKVPDGMLLTDDHKI